MRISDWSSDVCSSDLSGHDKLGLERRGDHLFVELEVDRRDLRNGRIGRRRRADELGVCARRGRHKKQSESRRCRGEKRLEHKYLQLRSEEHTSELQSLMRISYAVFCLKKTKKNTQI